MSEYQYYDFRAVDRPLSDQERAALRAISTRATITRDRFTNSYSYGNFRGDPNALMDKYFDAHLYCANWGTRQLMLRVPRASVDLELAKQYESDEALTVRGTPDHVIIDFSSNSDDDYEYIDEDDGDQLASLIPLRSDLIAGDMRSLYLGWLAGVSSEAVDDDDPEPPVPAGLGQLSGTLQQLAELLRVDDDLLKVAAARSAPPGPDHPAERELQKWLAGLQAADKDLVLLRLVCGEPNLRAELLRRYRADQAPTAGGVAKGEAVAPVRRTAGELLEARDRAADERRAQEAKKAAAEQARKAKELAAAQEMRILSLVGREQELWQKVETAVGAKLPREYDRAVALIQDLHALAKRSNAVGQFDGQLRQLRERHKSKRTFIERLDRAGQAGGL